MRDSDRFGIVDCITCKKREHWKNVHAGHFVKRSVNSLRYDSENVNGQCGQCNVYKYGEQYAYSKALDEKYGDGTAKKLFDRRGEQHKFTKEELQQIIDDSKEEIKFYEKNH